MVQYGVPSPRGQGHIGETSDSLSERQCCRGDTGRGGHTSFLGEEMWGEVVELAGNPDCSLDSHYLWMEQKVYTAWQRGEGTCPLGVEVSESRAQADM